MDDLSFLKTELSQARLALSIVSQINQIKTGFLGRSAHELRSPLSSLTSLLQLIVNDLCDNPQEEREFLAQALAAAGRLMVMIDELVMVSKLDYGAIAFDLNPIDLAALLDDLYSLIHLLANNRNIRLKICPPEPLIYCRGDRSRLLQGLMLILDGLIRLQEGGEIELGTEWEMGNPWVGIIIKTPFSEPWWQNDGMIPPLPEPITPETLQDWSQRIHFSLAMQGQLLRVLVEGMGGGLAIEVLEQNLLKMTQLRVRLPACNPPETDPR